MEMSKKTKTRATSLQGERCLKLRSQEVSYLYTFSSDHSINPTRIIPEPQGGEQAAVFHCTYSKPSLNVTDKFFDLSKTPYKETIHLYGKRNTIGYLI